MVSLFLCRVTKREIHTLQPVSLNQNIHTNLVTHVVLPHAAKGSNENKWQSSFPTGTRGGT